MWHVMLGLGLLALRAPAPRPSASAIAGMHHVFAAAGLAVSGLPHADQDTARSVDRDCHAAPVEGLSNRFAKFGIALGQALPIGLSKGSFSAQGIFSPIAGYAVLRPERGAGSIVRSCTLPASHRICWLTEVRGLSGPSDVTAMRRASTNCMVIVCPLGRTAVRVTAARAQTSRPFTYDSPPGPPGGLVRLGRIGTTWPRKCLSMPPTPRRLGLWWSTETRSKNLTSRP